MRRSLVKNRSAIIIIFVLITSTMMITTTNSQNSDDSGTEFKFMTYNVEASGEDPKWKDVVKEENADIIAFIETGSWDDDNNDLLDQYCSEFNSYFNEKDPYNCVGTESIPWSTSGEAIFSRYPIEFTNQIGRVTLDDGTVVDVSHDFLHAAITIGESTLNVIASHLKCCDGSENIEKREKHQEGIINYMDDLGDVPLIYAGDLNSYSPFDTENRGNLEDGPVSMLLNDTGYENKASTVHQFTDVFRTLNPDDPGFTYGHQNQYLQSRIDFIFANQYVSDDPTLSTVGDTTSADEGSDHYSVDATLVFDPEDSEGNLYSGAVSDPNTINIEALPLFASILSLSGLKLIRRRD